MLNAIYSRCIVQICTVNLSGMILVRAMKKKIAYNNSLRRLLALSKHNSASEMCCKFEHSIIRRIIKKVCL